MKYHSFVSQSYLSRINGAIIPSGRNLRRRRSHVSRDKKSGRGTSLAISLIGTSILPDPMRKQRSRKPKTKRQIDRVEGPNRNKGKRKRGRSSAPSVADSFARKAPSERTDASSPVHGPAQHPSRSGSARSVDRGGGSRRRAVRLARAISRADGSEREVRAVGRTETDRREEDGRGEVGRGCHARGREGPRLREGLRRQFGCASCEDGVSVSGEPLSR